MSIDIKRGREILGELQSGAKCGHRDLEVLFGLLDTLDSLWNSRRTGFASTNMAAMLGSEYLSNRVYDFHAVADRAVAAADALLEKLKETSNR